LKFKGGEKTVKQEKLKPAVLVNYYKCFTCLEDVSKEDHAWVDKWTAHIVEQLYPPEFDETNLAITDLGGSDPRCFDEDGSMVVCKDCLVDLLVKDVLDMLYQTPKFKDKKF